MSQRVFETQTGIQLLDSRFIKKFQEHTDSYHPPSQLPGFWIQNSGHSTFVFYQPYHFKSLAIDQRESLWEMRKMQRTCPRSGLWDASPSLQPGRAFLGSLKQFKLKRFRVLSSDWTSSFRWSSGRQFQRFPSKRSRGYQVNLTAFSTGTLCLLWGGSPASTRLAKL